MSRNDVIYAFFASEQALIPAILARALRRRFVVTTGGYDTADVPEQRYGLALRGRRWLPRSVLRCADRVLPISKAAKDDLEALAPSAVGRSVVVPLAVDPEVWTQRPIDRIPGRVVTVGYVDEVSWRRKGVDRFIALAKLDGEREYVLAGRVAAGMRERLETMRPPNLRLTGFLPQAELLDLLWSSDLYVQLSWHEGFGLAVAEAMACGCVPVVSAIPSLEEVVDRWGQVATGASDLDAIDLATRVPIDRAAMRRDVLRRFAPERRAGELARAVGVK